MIKEIKDARAVKLKHFDEVTIRETFIYHGDLFLKMVDSHVYNLDTCCLGEIPNHAYVDMVDIKVEIINIQK